MPCPPVASFFTHGLEFVERNSSGYGLFGASHETVNAVPSPSVNTVGSRNGILLETRDGTGIDLNIVNDESMLWYLIGHIEPGGEYQDDASTAATTEMRGCSEVTLYGVLQIEKESGQPHQSGKPDVFMILQGASAADIASIAPWTPSGLDPSMRIGSGLAGIGATSSVVNDAAFDTSNVFEIRVYYRTDPDGAGNAATEHIANPGSGDAGDGRLKIAMRQQGDTDWVEAYDFSHNHPTLLYRVGFGAKAQSSRASTNNQYIGTTLFAVGVLATEMQSPVHSDLRAPAQWIADLDTSDLDTLVKEIIPDPFAGSMILDPTTTTVGVSFGCELDAIFADRGLGTSAFFEYRVAGSGDSWTAVSLGTLDDGGGFGGPSDNGYRYATRVPTTFNPGTLYEYRLRVMQGATAHFSTDYDQDTWPTRTFRTIRERGSADDESILCVSCIRTHGSAAATVAVREATDSHTFDLCLAPDDFFYPDINWDWEGGPAYTTESFVHTAQHFWHDPCKRAFFRTVPVITQYGDHEVGPNNWGWQELNGTTASSSPGSNWSTFYSSPTNATLIKNGINWYQVVLGNGFANLPETANPESVSGISRTDWYRRLPLANGEVFVIDTRTHDTRTLTGAGSTAEEDAVLGDAQNAQVADWYASLTSGQKYTLLLSPNCMSDINTNADDWEGLNRRNSRSWLFDQIDASAVNTLVVTGDRHVPFCDTKIKDDRVFAYPGRTNSAAKVVAHVCCAAVNSDAYGPWRADETYQEDTGAGTPADPDFSGFLHSPPRTLSFVQYAYRFDNAGGVYGTPDLLYQPGDEPLVESGPSVSSNQNVQSYTVLTIRNSLGRFDLACYDGRNGGLLTDTGVAGDGGLAMSAQFEDSFEAASGGGAAASSNRIRNRARGRLQLGV